MTERVFDEVSAVSLDVVNLSELQNYGKRQSSRRADVSLTLAVDQQEQCRNSVLSKACAKWVLQKVVRQTDAL